MCGRRRGKPRLYQSALIGTSYFATNPAGCAELVTFVALLKDPLVVSALKAEMLLDALLDTYRNFPLECMVIATGLDPVDTLEGLSALSAPVVGLIRNADTVLESWFTT